MRLEDVIRLADAVGVISTVTETFDVPEVIDSLTGTAWCEEVASELKQFHDGEHPVFDSLKKETP